MKTADVFVTAVALDITCTGVLGFTSSPAPAPLATSDVDSPVPSIYSSSVASETHPDYPHCDVPAHYIANTFCNTAANTALCGWDGGDCCKCTCVLSPYSYCGYPAYNCKNSNASVLQNAGCYTESIAVPPVSSCPQDIELEWIVENTANATILAEAILCSRGDFEVEWRGHVDIVTTIHVLDGTSVRIAGVSDAVADGGGTVQMFLVSNGSLSLNNIRIVNGAGAEGGAIIATKSSELIAENVAFSSNTAENVGGAIYAASSNAELVSTTFDSNSAGYGGALFVLNSTVLGRGYTIFTRNNASGNGGAIFITQYSYLGWNMRPVFPATVLQPSTSGYSEDKFSYNDTWPKHDGSSYNDSSDFDSSHVGSSTFGQNSSDTSYGFDIKADWIVSDDHGTTSFINNSAGNSGGAMFAEGCEIFCSGTTSLEGNKAQNGGALYLENGVYFQKEDTAVFASNVAAFNGGAIGGTTISEGFDGHSLLIMNDFTIMVNNTCGGNGGAIDLTGISFLANGNMSFEGNSAVSYGGALYATQANIGPTLVGVEFSGNIAEAGGAVYFSAVGVLQRGMNVEVGVLYVYASKFLGCRFEDNSAYSTGGAIHTAAGTDIFAGTNFTGNSAEIGGGIHTSGTIALVGSSFVDNASGEGGGPAIFNGGVITNMYGLHFSGNRYYCFPDSFMDLNKTSVNNSRYEIVCDGCNTGCEECVTEDGYSVPVCEDLPYRAYNRDGKATLETLIVEAGHWRATSTSKSILACFNENACGGGVTGDPDYCLAGYEGPYCAVCSQDYAGTPSYRCNKCSRRTFIVPLVLASCAGLLVVLFVCHMISIKGCGPTWISADRIKEVLPIQSFKIIIISWQIVTQFSMVANATYPKLYQRFLDVFAFVNFDLTWIPSAGCVMDIDFHIELIIATAGPLALLVFLGLTYTVAVRRNRGSEEALKTVQRKHATAMIIITLLVYSSASSASFRAFACDSLDDGKVYLRSDYRIECSSHKHRAFQVYAAFMIAIYPLGIPLWFAFMLFRNREVLTNPALRPDDDGLFKQSTSTLWKPYKPSVFYFEVVECGRRVMLTGVVAFIYPNTAAQIAITLAIAFAFTIISERLDPYDSPWDRRLSRMAHVMVVLTMYEALLTKVDVSNEGAESQRLFAGILVTSHMVMIISAAVEAVSLMSSVRQQESVLPRKRSIPDFTTFNSS